VVDIVVVGRVVVESGVEGLVDVRIEGNIIVGVAAGVCTVLAVVCCVCAALAGVTL
jgi:hypothetical protein